MVEEARAKHECWIEEDVVLARDLAPHTRIDGSSDSMFLSCRVK